MNRIGDIGLCKTEEDTMKVFEDSSEQFSFQEVKLELKKSLCDESDYSTATSCDSNKFEKIKGASKSFLCDQCGIIATHSGLLRRNRESKHEGV